MPASKLVTRNDLQNVLAHINLGDDAHMEITQAEFDELSDEDKNDGTIYFITDGVSKNIFLDDNTPVGTITSYGGTTDPAYWLICDGRAISRTAYAELFAVIGTTYGSGDGSTTFNIPDLRGNVAVGANQNYTLGTSGGEATHQLTQGELPTTTGEFNLRKWGSGDLAFSLDGIVSHSTQTVSASNVPTSGSTNPNQAQHIQIQFGNNQAHNNMQPYIVTNYIIKASSSVAQGQSSLDIYYPIGTCYQTTDSTFNPSLRWGGTWQMSTSSLATNYSTTLVSDIITPNANADILNASFECRNGIAQLFINWKNKVAISASADGNITNIGVGTLVADKRPSFAATCTSYGDNGGPAFYIINNSGTIEMGAVGGSGATRTIAIGAGWQLGATYILQNSDITLYSWRRLA